MIARGTHYRPQLSAQTISLFLELANTSKTTALCVWRMARDGGDGGGAGNLNVCRRCLAVASRWFFVHQVACLLLLWASSWLASKCISPLVVHDIWTAHAVNTSAIIGTVKAQSTPETDAQTSSWCEYLA